MIPPSFLFVTALAVAAPAIAPAAAPAPASPLSPLRLKISAGDLLSAESILEVHRLRNGEDGLHLEGLGWLARGALLLGERDKAWRYTRETRRRCLERIAAGADPATDAHLATALGAAIEVEAQLRQREKGRRDAVRFLEDELTRIPGPVSLRSRIHKRINLLALEGTPAPALVVEDFLGPAPAPLASLRGRPVMLFVWDAGCGDCRAQSAALARATSRWRDRGLEVLALTRYHEGLPGRAAEKARVDSVWKAVYAGVGETPVILSTAAMERYGGSSTPTFVFIDRAGTVRGYRPWRFTEEELDRALAAICR